MGAAINSTVQAFKDSNEVDRAIASQLELVGRQVCEAAHVMRARRTM
jgi:hypothetical protein